jgi:hypothetical protein
MGYTQSPEAQCIYSIPCGCGRSYIGKPGRPLAMRLLEHRHNLQQGLLEKSKLAQHAYEEGHRNQPTQFGHFSYLDPPHQQ